MVSLQHFYCVLCFKEIQVFQKTIVLNGNVHLSLNMLTNYSVIVICTLNPRSFKIRANCVLTVDLPTPPLPESTKITRCTCSSIILLVRKLKIKYARNKTKT